MAEFAGNLLPWLMIAAGGLIAMLGGLWLVIPNLYGLPWVPARYPRIRRALEMAGTQPGDTVYDLGAGDGRALIVAAREFGAHAVGVEIEPVHCLVAWVWARIAGVSSQVTVHCADLYKSELDDADIVYLYLTPSHAKRIAPRLQEKLRAGARVVSLAADIAGWKPAAFDRMDLIFYYVMPPQPGGLQAYLAEKS